MIMKRIYLFGLLALFISATPLSAQIKFGIKGGLSSYNLSPNDLIITNSEALKELDIKVQQAELGIHFGIITQINLGGFFIQPEAVFNSNSVTFNIQDFRQADVISQTLSEKYQYLDIPVLLGPRLGPFRLGIGPVGHVFLNSTSELFDLSGYSQKFKELTYGWQGGIGIDLWKFQIDLRYEGNFSKFGDHITWNGTRFNFDQSPSRMLASLAITF